MPDPTLDIARFKAMLEQMRQMKEELHPPAAAPGPDPDAFHAQLQQEEASQMPQGPVEPQADPDTVHAQLSKEESGGGFWGALNKPISSYIPGVTDYLEKRAQPGLAESKSGSEWYQNPEAMLHGFSTGAIEAMTPAWAAGAATLGTGAPALAGNALLAAQGAHDAFDPNASTGQRIGGAANMLGGGFGALHGLLKPGGVAEGIAGAFKRTPSAPKSASDLAREVVAARTADFTTPQKRDVGRFQDAYENALSKKRATGRAQDTAAVEKELKQQQAMERIRATRAGMEEKQPTVSQTVSAEAGPGGKIRATRKWGVPSEEGGMDEGLPPTSEPSPTAPVAPAAPSRTPTGELRQPFLRDLPEGQHIPIEGEVPPAEPAATVMPAGYLEDLPNEGTSGIQNTTNDFNLQRGVDSYRKALEEDALDYAKPVGHGQTPAAADNAPVMSIEDANRLADEQIAQENRQGFQAIRGGKAGADIPTEPTVPEPIPEPAASPLAQMFLTKKGLPFKTGMGAAGANLRDAEQAVSRGDIASSEEAYNALARERAAKGLETKPQTPVAPAAAPEPSVTAADIPTPPEGEPYVPSTETTTPGVHEMTPDEIEGEMRLIRKAQEDPSFLERLKNLPPDEAGKISPLLMRLMGGATGAAIGAPIGASQEPDDKLLGALKGGTIGGLIGAGAMPTGEESLLRNMMQYRNAMLLAGPAQAKKVLGDIGGVGFEGLKRLITPGQTQTGANIFKEMGRVPTNARNYWRGLGPNPDIGTSIGDVARASTQSPLGWITRPFNAAMYASQEALKRAGVTNPETIQKILGVNTPETEAGRWWYGGQKYPAVQYLRPFAKIATNMAEGVRNVPGIGQFAGNPADRMQRQVIGGLQMGLGGLSEEYDKAMEESGKDRNLTSEALRAAAMGPQGVAPYALGKGLTAIAEGGPANALRELIRLIPGSQAVLPTMYPNETADAYAARVLKNPLTQIAPSVLLPETGTAR